MFRLLAFLVVPLGFLAAVTSGLRNAPRPFVAPTERMTAGPSSAARATPTPTYHPGEPSLVLDDAARLTRDANGHFTASVEVNGQSVDMVVDTGATAVALTLDDARRLGLAVDTSRFGVVGTGASGVVIGQTVILNDVAIGGRHVAGLEAVVLAGLDRSLLGQSYLRRLERVSIDGDTMTLR